MKKLTIGMAVYDDFDGAYFTIQSLRMHHLNTLDVDSEIIVIDNNPNTPSGNELRGFVENWANAQYIPFTEKTGAANSKNEIFNYASGDYTLCVDCHVLFETGSVQSLVDYYKKNPDTGDLIQGPLVYDNLVNYSTHFKPGWGSLLYGQWDTDRENYDKGEPFEIKMQGMGVFSCKTSEWPRFSPHFKGFGGEEGYIHEKFRQKGNKCLCLPELRWVHRFGRPNGIPYPNILEERLWNYFVGWLELLRDPQDPFFESIITEFKKSISEETIFNIFEAAKNTIGIK